MDLIVSRRLALLVLFVGIGMTQSFTQNLVPNPSFEVFDVCPVGYNGGFGPLQAPPWFIPTGGSSDYFNECTVGVVDVPNNAFCSNLPAHTGVAYAGGLYHYAGIASYREYLQVQLTEPLVAGQSYDVSFYYAVGDLTCGMDRLGVYISETPPQEPGNIGPLLLAPQVEITSLLVNNSWELFTDCYVAIGGEEYITIGNFYFDEDLEFETGCPLWGGMIISYVLIDDVSVEEGPPPGVLDFELPEDVTVCDEIEVTVPVNNAFYTWQDGSHDQTYIVTETGEYHVTVSKGCNVGFDTIEVTVLESPEPVELGEPEQIICPGDEISYNFDPDLGNFLWQDNSTSSSYVITTPGIYSLTISTVCGSEEDEVTVIGLEPPEPLELGEDTSLCPFEELEFDFDPGLGDFLWHNGSTGSSFTITEPGTYALTISNYCGEVEDEINVEYYPEPFVVFDEDTISLCEGESVTLSLDPEIGEYFWQDGEEGSEYEVTEPGVYSVTVVNACGSDNSSVVVAYDFEPIIELGPDITLCPEQFPYTFNLTGLSDVEHFLWEDGTTDPIFTIYDGGPYGVTVSNDCFEVWDFIDVTVEDAQPIVELGADTVLCPGEILFLDVGNIPGTYQWQDNNNGAVYGVSEGGLYSVTVTNLCGVGTDSIEVNFDDQLPSFNLGPDLNLCPGEEVTIFGGVSGVTYLWNNGSTQESIVVDSPGPVILTISNDCASIADTVDVAFNDDAPDPGLPAQLSICTGDTVTIATGVGGTYQWSTGSTGSSIDATQAGQYLLTVSNSCGMAIDTTQVVDLGNAPVFDLGSDGSICPGDTITYQPGIAGTYLWQDGSTGPLYEAGTGGAVILAVTNICGTTSDTVNVTLLSAIPSLDLGPDASLCPGDAVVLDPGIANVSYLWANGSTNPTFTGDTAGPISLSISNACGISRDTMVISLLPDVPPLNLGVDFSICPGDVVDLTPGLAGVSYEWQDGSTGNSYVVSGAGQVILTITNSCGSIADTIVVTENTTGPSLELGADIFVCEGETVLIEPGVNGVSYEWQDGSTNTSFLVTSSAQVILTIANSCGSAQDTIDVVIDGTAPSVELGPDELLCDGETLTLQVDNSNAQVEWQNGSSNATQLISIAGVYYVSLTNSCGVATDTVTIDTEVSPASFNLGTDQTICEGEVVVLQAPAINAGSTLEWSTGSANASINVTNAGNYSLTISNVCGQASDAVAISVDVAPDPFDLGGDHAICAGEMVVLQAPSISAGSNLLWSTGSAGTSINVTQSGEYSLVVSNNCGETTDAVTVEVNTEELEDVEDNIFEFCDGDVLMLDVQQPIVATYLWNTGVTVPQLAITNTGNYIVTISSECDELIEDIVVDEGDCVNPNVFIPNVFSPNGDNINDVFEIDMDTRDLVEFQVWIYDRWGDVMFNALSADFEWKGDFNGKTVQPGVYVYHILVGRQTAAGIISERLKGDVTIVR